MDQPMGGPADGPKLVTYRTDIAANKKLLQQKGFIEDKGVIFLVTSLGRTKTWQLSCGKTCTLIDLL